MSWTSFLPFLEPLIGWGREASQRRHERKQAKHQQELARIEAEGRAKVVQTEARAQREAQRLTAEIGLETTAMENTRYSWKDEYVLLWMTGVVTGYFIPWTQPYVIAGFEAMRDTMPVWFQWAFGTVLFVSVGITQIKRFAPLVGRGS